MTDCHHNPATTAALDQLEAATKALATYANSLEAPDVIAELRCTTARLGTTLVKVYGPGNPLPVTVMAISHLLARFDLDGGSDGEGNTEVGFVPLPGAVAGSESCRCDVPDGGMIAHIKAVVAATSAVAAVHP